MSFLRAGGDQVDHVLRGGRMSIGRDPANDIVIDEDKRVSRRHAWIDFDGTRWVLHDAQSRNGTIVNGAPVSTHPLSPGDRITIGSRVFHFAETDDPKATIDEKSQPGGAGQGPRLSAREREILGLVADGVTDEQIAASLFISVATVRSHLDRIREKTGCRRRAELTRLAVDLGVRR